MKLPKKKKKKKLININCYPFGEGVEKEEDRVGGAGVRGNENELGM